MSLASESLGDLAGRADTAIGSRAATWIPALALIAILIAMPALVGRFVLSEVLALAFIYGIIALSLQFLAGYGGMVSLAQMTVAGVSGYMVAIFGENTMNFGYAWPAWAAIPIALAAAVVAGAVIGALSVRTAGIYTIMITLAIATAFYYFTLQNYDFFNGYNGVNGVLPPPVFGLNWRDPAPLYYLSLGVAALCYAAAVYVSRSTFGLALQGIRDNPRRMEALGFHVAAHRVAAHVFAGLIAGIGGILFVWHNARISPGTIDTAACIDILVIAVLGGMRHPIGAFIGALIYVGLSAFAIDLIEFAVGRERFKLVIGLGFLLVVLFSPDGVLGLWSKLRQKLARPSGANGF